VYLHPQAIEVQQGADYASPAFGPLLQADGVSAQSLVGYSARLAFSLLGQGPPFLTLTDAASTSGQVSLGALGTASFTVSRAATALFLDRSGVWSLLVVDPSGKTTPLAGGTWTRKLTP
jgi:hypothetical protein